MRRNVFSIVFSWQQSQSLLVFKLATSRRNFYTLIERRSFHAAKTHSRRAEGSKCLAVRLIGRIDISTVRRYCWACSDVKGCDHGTLPQTLRSFPVRRD